MKLSGRITADTKLLQELQSSRLTAQGNCIAHQHSPEIPVPKFIAAGVLSHKGLEKWKVRPRNPQMHGQGYNDYIYSWQRFLANGAHFRNHETFIDLTLPATFIDPTMKWIFERLLKVCTYKLLVKDTKRGETTLHPRLWYTLSKL